MFAFQATNSVLWWHLEFWFLQGVQQWFCREIEKWFLIEVCNLWECSSFLERIKRSFLRTLLLSSLWDHAEGVLVLSQVEYRLPLLLLCQGLLSLQFSVEGRGQLNWQILGGFRVLSIHRAKVFLEIVCWVAALYLRCLCLCQGWSQVVMIRCRIRSFCCQVNE